MERLESCTLGVPRFTVVDYSSEWADDEIAITFLQGKGLFKALSLLASARAGLPAPPTLLLLTDRGSVLERYIEEWRLPLLVRMDFTSTPTQKPLGGVAVYSLDALRKVVDFLFSVNCVPMLHPHLDRFDDVYSAGIMIAEGGRIAHVEIVGRGFDASDLRLGSGTPHETLRMDLLSSEIIERSLIPPITYEEERKARIAKVRNLHKYTEFVNREGRLLPSLRDIEGDERGNEHYELQVAEAYEPMPLFQVKHLVGLAQTIHLEVLPILPRSHSFVASLSYIPKHGWVLWDIYGQWYQR